MKKKTGQLEAWRVTWGEMASDSSLGFNGAFLIPYWKDVKQVFKVICSDGEGWDHVSVSLPGRCPTWTEMRWIKQLFWDDDEAVMQLHPPKPEWVNNHRYCLHLWRKQDNSIPLPPQYMVGIQELGDCTPAEDR